MIIKKEDLSGLASRILSDYPDQRIFVLDGEMGAGKTTFTTEFTKELGAIDYVSSPTFSIVNVYLCDNGEEIFHFDFYRLEEVSEALNIGVEEYFESGNYCFIEWPDLVKKLLPDSYVNIRIEHVDNPNERNVSVDLIEIN